MAKKSVKKLKEVKKPKKTPKFKIKEKPGKIKVKSKKEEQEELGVEEKEALMQDSDSSDDELLEDLESDLGKCARCEKALPEDPIQLELGGEIYKFCSEECADKFEPDVE